MNLKPRNTEKSDIFISSVDYLSLDSGLTLSLSITLILYLYYECFPVLKVPILMLFWCSVLMLLQVTLASLIFLRNLFEVLKIMKKICTHIFCIVCASFWPCSCGVRCHGSLGTSCWSIPGSGRCHWKVVSCFWKQNIYSFIAFKPTLQLRDQTKEIFFESLTEILIQDHPANREGTRHLFLKKSSMFSSFSYFPDFSVSISSSPTSEIICK